MDTAIRHQQAFALIALVEVGGGGDYNEARVNAAMGAMGLPPIASADEMVAVLYLAADMEEITEGRWH